PHHARGAVAAVQYLARAGATDRGARVRETAEGDARAGGRTPAGARRRVKPAQRRISLGPSPGRSRLLLRTKPTFHIGRCPVAAPIRNRSMPASGGAP